MIKLFYILYCLLVLILLAGCSKSELESEVQSEFITKGKETLVGIWICDNLPSEFYPEKIMIRDRAPDVSRHVYRRYKGFIGLSQVSNIDYYEDPVYGHVLAFTSKRYDNSDDDLFRLARISLDTLKLLDHKQSYLWVRQ